MQKNIWLLLVLTLILSGCKTVEIGEINPASEKDYINQAVVDQHEGKSLILAPECIQKDTNEATRTVVIPEGEVMYFEAGEGLYGIVLKERSLIDQVEVVGGDTEKYVDKFVDITCTPATDGARVFLLEIEIEPKIVMINGVSALLGSKEDVYVSEHADSPSSIFLEGIYVGKIDSNMYEIKVNNSSEVFYINESVDHIDTNDVVKIQYLINDYGQKIVKHIEKKEEE